MRRRVWTAWSASALAHALLLAALLWLARARPTGDRAAPLELDIVVEAPSPDLRTGETALAPAARTGSSSAAPARPLRRRGVPAGQSAAPDIAAVPEIEAAPDTGAEPDAASAPAGQPNLSLDVVPADRRAAIAGPAPDVVVRAAPKRRPSVDELRADLERKHSAIANVIDGRVDPLLYDYLRGARTRFEAEARRLADRIALGAGDTVSGWGRGYLKGVADARKPRGGSERGPELADPSVRRRPDLADAYGESERMAKSGAEERRVEICLDVAAGRDTSATIRRGSGNAGLDAVALEAFEKAIAARPVPPDARTGRACYEVLIAAHRAPPLPFVSCGFDSTGITCMWPFKRVTAVSGRLLSVEYPDRR